MRKTVFDKHVENCDTTKVQGDTLHRALTMADMFINEDRRIQWYTRHKKNPKLAMVRSPEPAECRKVRTGWTRRPKWGQSMGDTTIDEFKSQLKIWFQIGAAQPLRKMSASRMYKLLQAMNPQRYDLPTENQIKQYISSLVQDEKKKKASEAGNDLAEDPNSRTNNDQQLNDVPVPRRVPLESHVKGTSGHAQNVTANEDVEVFCSAEIEGAEEPPLSMKVVDTSTAVQAEADVPAM